MKQLHRFFQYMNPPASPQVREEMDRRSLRSIHIIAWLVLFFELAAFVAFLFSRAGHFDHEALVNTISVCSSIVLCSTASVLSKRMLEKEHLAHSGFFVFKFFFFIVFTVTAVMFDYRNYRAGNQMLTFYAVNLVMVCFFHFRPWVGSILVAMSFTGLFIPLYLYDGAARIEPLNLIVLALASMASNAVRYHALLNVSKKTIQLAENNAVLKEASRRDGLTGLQNRLALEDDAAGMDGRRMTVYMIDINYFKEINDQYGHTAGDAILREVSQTLKRLFPDAHYYRYGGDEFLVLTYKSPADNYGADTAEVREARFGVEVLLSIGNAQGCPTDYQELFDLISKADKSLYVTKQRTHSAAFGGHERRKTEG